MTMHALALFSSPVEDYTLAPQKLVDMVKGKLEEAVERYGIQAY